MCSIVFICNLSNGDIISIVSLVVNSCLAIWVVKNLQKNLANRRYLKNHIISEIKDLKSDYRNFLNELHLGKIKPKKIAPWLKLINIKVQDVMEIVSDKYKIDENTLRNYQVELRKVITEFDEFILNYKENKCFKLKDKSIQELIKFQQNNSSKFNSLIIKINDNG